MTLASLKSRILPSVACRRYLLPTVAVALVAAGVLTVALPVQAQSSIDEIVKLAIGSIAQAIVGFLGQVMLLVVGVLISVASYNSFVTEPIVGNGWVIVRDICNMFFIGILLLMAFGTIVPGLGRFTVHGDRPGGNLVRLLVVAIVINFSRTICGLLIDLSQVIMLTFVSGFKEAAGGNFVEALGLNKVLQDNPGTSTMKLLEIIAAYLLAIVMTAVALFTVVVLTVSLLVRIIYLWLLTIISPIAFLARAVPAGKIQGIYSSWWDKFNEMLVTGPLQAFFLWLALITVQSGSIGTFETKSTGETVGGVTQAFQEQNIQRFLIATCLLLVGNQLAKQFGGAASQMGFKAGELAKRKAAQYGKAGARLAGRGAVAAASRIPVSGKDETTGRRVTLGAAAGARWQQVKESRVGQMFTKEGRAWSAKQRRADALRAIGRTDEADKMQAEINERGAIIKSRMGDDQLLAAAKNPSASPLDRKQAALALARKGHGSLMGQGKDAITALVNEATNGRGDKQLVDQMVKALKDKGDKRADMSKDDIAEVMREEPKKKMAFLSQGKMELNETGRLTDQPYAQVLKGVNGDEFNQFRASIQSKILDDLTKGVAALSASGDSAGAAEMAAKQRELMEGRMAGMKPQDYETMSANQRESTKEELLRAAQAQAAAGDGAAADRLRAKRMAMSGKDGMLGGMAAATAAGDVRVAGHVVDDYLGSRYGQRLMGMSNSDFQALSGGDRDSAEQELVGVWRMMDRLGDARKDDVKDQLEQMTGVSYNEPGLRNMAAATVQNWEAAGRSAFGNDGQEAAALFSRLAEAATSKRTAAVMSGAAERSDADRVVAQAIRRAQDIKPAGAGLGVRDGIHELQEAVSQLSGGAAPAALAASLDNVINEMSRTVNAANPTVVRDAQGQQIDAFKNSDVGKAIATARDAGDTKVALDNLKRAVREMTQMLVGAGRDRRGQGVTTAKQAVSNLGSAGDKLAAALKRGDEVSRVKDVRQALNGVSASIKFYGSDTGGSPLSDSQRQQLKDIESEIKRLGQEVRNVKKVDTKSTAEITALVNKLKGFTKNI